MPTCNKSSTNNLQTKQAIQKLIQLTRTHRKIIENRTQHTELHMSQHRMLMHISKFDNIPSQSELATHFGISPAAVAASLKKLCADGYIERCKADGNDTRKNQIKITDKGIREIALSREYFDFVDNTMFNGFDEGEIQAFIYLMERAQNNLLSIEN